MPGCRRVCDNREPGGDAFGSLRRMAEDYNLPAGAGQDRRSVYNEGSTGAFAPEDGRAKGRGRICYFFS